MQAKHEYDDENGSSNADSQVKLWSISDISLNHTKYIHLSTSIWILDIMISITDAISLRDNIGDSMGKNNGKKLWEISETTTGKIKSIIQ